MPARVPFLAVITLAAFACSDAGAAREPASAHSLPPATLAPGEGGFVMRTVVDSGVTYRYQVFVPSGLTPESRPPVILFLHGNSEKGTDTEKPTRSALGAAVRAAADLFPAIVVFPQSPVGDFPRIHRRYGRIALAALDSAIAEFHADPSRVYLSGVSYGSIVGYELAYDAPTRFAAFVPVASKNMCCIVTGALGPGGEEAVDSALVKRLARLPIWQFKGGADSIGSLPGMHHFVAAMRAEGAPIRYTEYPGRGHDVWDQAYGDPALWRWLFTQHATR